jgi:hypothetical protein
VGLELLEIQSTKAARLRVDELGALGQRASGA